MIPKPRIYISTPFDKVLQPGMLKIKKEILRAIEAEGMDLQEFMVSGLPQQTPFSFESANQLMSRCQGAVILGFARWEWTVSSNQVVRMPTEYNHIEGALAIAHQVPLLILAEEGVMNRGIVWMGGGHLVTPMPVDQQTKQDFRQRFEQWCNVVKSRPRVFLGYCGQAKATADAITLYLEHALGVSVRNYAFDFHQAVSILDEIERAARDCMCGIFLFTSDDVLAASTQDKAAPRDNVVFEAGYFMHAKGIERTLIIREEGAKMPADVGGNIYVSLKDRKDISTIQEQLRRFLEDCL